MTTKDIFYFSPQSEATEDAFKVKGVRGGMNDGETLSNFGKWMYQMRESKNITTNYDIAMWMTKSVNI